MKVLSTNILANHPAYGKIIATYNAELRANGKVNDKKFYETIILPEIPEYKMSSWYKFLRKFKTEAGIVPLKTAYAEGPVMVGEEGKELAQTMKGNQEATVSMIRNILNISERAAQEILENPELLSYEKRVELGLKVMKAQDSRVKAIGTIRADNREQERFDRAMDSAAFA